MPPPEPPPDIEASLSKRRIDPNSMANNNHARLDAAAGELVAWRRLRRRRSVLALLEARPLRRRPGGQAVREHRRPSEAGVCATCELACEACACVVQREGSVRGCTCGQRGRFGISADASPFWRRLEIGCPPARLEMLVACTRYLRPHFFATILPVHVEWPRGATGHGPSNDPDRHKRHHIPTGTAGGV